MSPEAAAEIGTLQGILHSLPQENVIDRMSIQSRIDRVIEKEDRKTCDHEFAIGQGHVCQKCERELMVVNKQLVTTAQLNALISVMKGAVKTISNGLNATPSLKKELGNRRLP